MFLRGQDSLDGSAVVSVLLSLLEDVRTADIVKITGMYFDLPSIWFLPPL